MEKKKVFFANRKGMYRIAFTICILFLSGLVVTITENNNVDENNLNTETKSVTETAVIETEVEVLDEAEELSADSQEENILYVDSEDETNEENHESFTDVSISPPIYGRVQKAFSIDEPLYNKTMDDWRIHTGVDIACFYGAEVYAAQDGVITDIGYDLNFGNYVTTKNGEYELHYTSLSSDIELEVGDVLTKGQLISTVSDSCVSEICDEPHFHFEIKKNDEFVNPEEYVMFE